MNIYPVYSKVSFSARLNDSTRKEIQANAKMSPKLEGFDERLDNAIKNSPLNDFENDNTTISLGSNRGTFVAGQINTRINDRDIKIAIPNYGLCVYPDNTDESAIFQLGFVNADILQKQLIESIKNVDINEIKTLLAQEYLRQCFDEMIDSTTAQTYDKIMNGKFELPEV